MLLRKFLEDHRKNFKAGQPTTAIDLQIIALLSNAHIFAFETLQAQIRIHGLKWDRICRFEPSPWLTGPGFSKKAMIFGYAYQSQLSLSKWNYPLNGNSMILLPPDIVAVGTVVDVAVDPADFVGIFCRDLISPNPSTSTDSRLFFTTDDTPLGVDQILMAPAVIPLDFTEPLAQLRASFNQIQTERVQKRDDAEKLKEVLLLHIHRLERRFTEILNQQDSLYRGLFSNVAFSQAYDDKFKRIEDRKDALSHEIMEFRVQAQENYNHLTSQLSELVDYINRGRDDKKGESGSSCGLQPPDDRGRPGSGDGGNISGGGSRSEPPWKRGGGGSQRRDWRYWIGGN
ncbi:hypothetical protein F511_21111 [Dorcoceras hygrometricum]|uniref:Uncharacterized protein n=1 Tax=Dorcoceras hygrometricum TaxID=472368 RepID=A0A2Z7CKS6_9LAMI|nr:hypothetical protein F511_21111 [Dorcoceras hygrometricum]